MITEFDPLALLRALVERKLDFVVIGGVAATLHGSAAVTIDLDVCYERSQPNVRRLVDVLESLNARLRVAREPEHDLPFRLDEESILAGDSFNFDTDLGPLDCIAHPPGIDDFGALASTAERYELDGVSVAVASLDDVLRMKRKAGRAKDLAVTLELEEIGRMRRETG